MTTENDNEIFKTGVQCFKAILTVFFVCWVIVQYHEPMLDGTFASIDFLADRIVDGFLFAFPALPSVCAVLMAFMLWLICLSFKLACRCKLTKALWEKFMTWFWSAFAFNIVAYSGWMTITNSGPTALKVFSTIGLIICCVGAMFLCVSYNDQTSKPDQ